MERSPLPIAISRHGCPAAQTAVASLLFVPAHPALARRLAGSQVPREFGQRRVRTPVAFAASSRSFYDVMPLSRCNQTYRFYLSIL